MAKAFIAKEDLLKLSKRNSALPWTKKEKLQFRLKKEKLKLNQLEKASTKKLKGILEEEKNRAEHKKIMGKIEDEIDNVEVIQEEISINQVVQPYSTEEELTEAM